MIRCFISHTWREGEHHFAMRLASALKKRQIKVWIDEEKISPGSFIMAAIQRAIKHEVDIFIFIMSPASLRSRWCRIELKLALSQEEYCIPIIPVLIKPSAIPRSLKNIKYADFTKPSCFDSAMDYLIAEVH
ncbi:MAG: hypothetical protein A2Y62_02695 [Candidatus Fischerbacteria bacterium RBG_13_37_8]|uniref:TIR domain-containing protein n=1 Tax=Candidatus Fischerbacteria bacterium RBG_13_37_8 TaxID=1817863 RepID=A0A1F5VRX5_9BACT|nr:MAG: hypothetical protein A2Y62_02695 [Candidatus Fischerbacteria bacterium RBG_13_37_8]